LSQMPYGCFFIQVNEKAEIERNTLYLVEGSPEIVIGDNEILRIRMGHSDKKYVLTVLPDYQFYTLKGDVKEGKKITSFFAGLILSKEEENATTFKDPLQNFYNQLIPNRTQADEDFQASITEAYNQLFQIQKTGFDLKELEHDLSDRVKSLTKKGKFDEANLLLDKMKKIPPKVAQAYKNAEAAIKRQDYEKAEKEFENAYRFAEELEENDLAKMLKSRAQVARRIPDLLKRREDCIDKALQNLRNDNFGEASKQFKMASDISSDLMDTRHVEEYSLKAKALSEYVKVDKKYNK
jgi:tetratricopeptide (TPR) repeat protein